MPKIEAKKYTRNEFLNLTLKGIKFAPLAILIPLLRSSSVSPQDELVINTTYRVKKLIDSLQPKPFEALTESEIKTLADNLLTGTKQKKERGVDVNNFPLPKASIEELAKMSSKERIELYTNTLANIWRFNQNIWTPYDELSWQAITGENGHGKKITQKKFTPKIGIGLVSNTLQFMGASYFKDGAWRAYNSIIGGINLSIIQELVLGQSDGLGESEFLTTLLHNPFRRLDIVTFSERRSGLENTVHAIFSIPRFNYLEARITNPLFTGDPYPAVVNSQ